METPERVLRRLEFKVVRRLDGFLFGDYRGIFYGPSLDLAVTSREPLHLSGEQEYPVDALLHDDAVRLFEARARAVKPDFAPVGAIPHICRRLADLPLALHLAAASGKAWPAQRLKPPASPRDRAAARSGAVALWMWG